MRARFSPSELKQLVEEETRAYVGDMSSASIHLRCDDRRKSSRSSKKEGWQEERARGHTSFLPIASLPDPRLFISRP